MLANEEFHLKQDYESLTPPRPPQIRASEDDSVMDDMDGYS